MWTHDVTDLLLWCRWQGKQVKLSKQLKTNAWAGVQEHNAALPEPNAVNQQVYAGVPFRQWLSPNGQWRVRPIRCAHSKSSAEHKEVAKNAQRLDLHLHC